MGQRLRVSASEIAIPPKTYGGTSIKISLSHAKRVVSRVLAVLSGTMVVISEKLDRVTAAEKAALIHARLPIKRSAGNQSDLKCTISAPTVMPSMAILIARNAKWYHRMTEMTLVCTTCNIKQLMHIRKTPDRNQKPTWFSFEFIILYTDP